MAVIRQMNWTSQQRVDVPHARMIEQGVVGDFDALAGNMLAGKQPMVVRGFTVDSLGIGNQAKDLTINVANAALINFGATEPGSIFVSPADATTLSLDATQNDLVVGGFTASATNYLGIDLSLVADDTTADKVAFLVPVTEQETYQTIDVAKTLKYKFVISTQFFSANTAIVPIAKIVVNSSGVVTSITDCRPMMFRLGSGGDSPSATSYFAFANSRTENSITSTVAGTDPFLGTDKSISSLKEWQDAIMTRIWETGGGEHWYSPTGLQDVFMVTEGTTFTNNDYFEMYGSNYLNFRGIKFLFSNSTAAYNTVTDYTAHDNNVNYQFADGDVLYVDLQRGTNAATLTAAKLPWNLLYVGVTNPGNRIPIAWRRGSTFFARNKSYPVGVSVPPATTTTLGTVLLSATPTSSTLPVTVTYDTSLKMGIVETGLKATQTTAGVKILSAVTPGSATNGVLEVDNSGGALSGSDKILVLKNNAVSKFTIDKDGKIGSAGNIQRFLGSIDVAENITSYYLNVDNGGIVTANDGYRFKKVQVPLSSFHGNRINTDLPQTYPGSQPGTGSVYQYTALSTTSGELTFPALWIRGGTTPNKYISDFITLDDFVTGGTGNVLQFKFKFVWNKKGTDTNGYLASTKPYIRGRAIFIDSTTDIRNKDSFLPNTPTTWVNATYAAHDCIFTGTDKTRKIYVCVGAGTSTVAPTGIGVAISPGGTSVWKYIGQEFTFGEDDITISGNDLIYPYTLSYKNSAYMSGNTGANTPWSCALYLENLGESTNTPDLYLLDCTLTYTASL